MEQQLDTYRAAHRYDGAAIQRERTEVIRPCAVQPRDVAILRDVWRYKFLTAPQILELWWPGKTERAGQRRLRMLFEAGYVDRFRPIARRGSFPWTFQLAAEGHRLLQLADEIPDGERFNPRRVYDYGHVLHEIQLNAWVLAYRRATRPAFLSWDGETAIVPETDVRSPEGVRLDDDWSPEDLRNERVRPVRPDAVLEVERGDGLIPHTMLVEYDRTNRVDKNYDKFRRYDMYLNWWWRETELRDADAPLIVFVCQDAAHLEQFVRAADHELTGHLWHPGVSVHRYDYVGRRNVLFVCERDMHAGDFRAWRVPEFPPRHPSRDAVARRCELPGAPPAPTTPEQLGLFDAQR